MFGVRIRQLGVNQDGFTLYENLFSTGRFCQKSYEVSKVARCQKCINFKCLSVRCQGSGSNAKSDAFGTKVFPVAGLAVDLSLPLTELAAVHSLVADVAGEAGLVPGLPGSPHQLGNEDWLPAPRTVFSPAPLGFKLPAAADLLLRDDNHVVVNIL